jgi:type IX secretion system PorP/SprF family membrane protein
MRTNHISLRNGRWLRLLPLLLLPFTAKAQQDPMYSMYMWNMMTVMPGYAGSADVLNVTAMSRMQWTGIQGAPRTQSLSAHAPINMQSLGLGGSIVHDQIGRTATTSAFADIAYRMRIVRKTRLAFGLKMGLNHAQMANTRVENTDPNDPTFAFDQSGKLFPNFGFGTYLWSRKGYFGISVPKILRNYLSTTYVDGSDLRFGREATHMFITGGYVFPLGTVKFKPSFLVKLSEGAPISTDISANFLFHDRFWLGAAYRQRDCVTAILSLQINDQFRAGYAYDLGISKLATRSNGSHEIMISYDPVFTRERVRSPRYF